MNIGQKGVNRIDIFVLLDVALNLAIKQKARVKLMKKSASRQNFCFVSYVTK